MLIINWFSSVSKKAANRVEVYGSQYNATVIFFTVFYIANPLKWQFNSPYPTSTLIILRVISVILCLLLAMWRIWPSKLRPCLPIFWLFVLFYNLPFRTTFTILNSANSHSYAAYGVLGFVVLGVLVDNILYVWLTATGLMTGAAVYYLGGGYALPIITLSTIGYASYMIFSISFIKLVFFRNHNLRLQSQISTYKTLAGAIAHEVRGPLSAINIACQGMEDNPNLNGPEEIKSVGQLNRKVLSIIDAILLQIKFIESNRAVEKKKVNLFECLTQACNDPIFSHIDRELISVSIEKKSHVRGDRKLITQVFTNLLRNSLRALKKTKSGQIEIASQSSGNYLLVTVFDNGPGISLEQQKNLFKPFFSLNKNGIGLGLAFSKLVLENMGGKITCESQEGSFTRFIISLKTWPARRK